MPTTSALDPHDFLRLRGPVWARLRSQDPRCTHERFEDAYAEWWTRELARRETRDPGQRAEPEEPVAYVATAVHRMLVDEYRAANRGLARDAAGVTLVTLSSGMGAVQAQTEPQSEALAHRLGEALAQRLTRRQLAVCVLGDLEGRPTVAVARRLRITPRQVRRDRERVLAAAADALRELLPVATTQPLGWKLPDAFELIATHREDCEDCRRRLATPAHGGRARLSVAAAATVAAVALVPAATATPAQAGTYKVFSCKTPAGTPAPTDGWTHLQQGGKESSPSNNCATGGGLAGTLNGDHRQNSGDQLGWRFSVPDGLQLRSFRMWRTFSTTAASELNATPYAYVSWPSPNYTPDARNACVAGEGCGRLGSAAPELNPTDYFAADNLGDEVRSVYVMAGCGGQAGCVDRESSIPMAQATVKAFEAQLQDNTAPVVSNVTGPLAAADQIHSGTEPVAFDASDTGSGVYRIGAELRREGQNNWDTVATQVVNANNGDCADADPSNGDPYEFLRRVPCPSQAGGSFALDTLTIPNGAHQLRLWIEDAAGNRSTAVGPLKFRVTNGDNGILGLPTNGAQASDTAAFRVNRGTRRAARNLRFGQRHRLVATIRDPEGRPVRGAQVEVLQRTDVPGAEWVPARRPMKTGDRGQLRWTVPAGPSRTLRLAYKANVLNGSYQAISDIPLRVAAKTSLQVGRRSYRNGQTIRFRGTVASKPIPKGGALIDLQAYKRGSGWVTFATRRTRADGRWAESYRLRATTRSTRYRFRARVRQDTNYPYAAGKTRPVSVSVRP